MVERFARFSLAIFEISRCWHKLAAEEMAAYGLRGAHAIYLTAMYRCKDGVTGPSCASCAAGISPMCPAPSLSCRKRVL